MALIDIPTKGISDTLTSTEFNQLLQALKTGQRDIYSLSVTATDATFTGNVNITGGLTVDGESGPFAKFYELDNIIYVSSSGGVYDGIDYDGSSPGKAISTFQDAIDNVEAIHGSAPSREDTISIVCLDSSTYEEPIICVDHVEIYAPNAILKLGGIGSKQLVLADNKVTFNKIFRDTGANVMIEAAHTGGEAIVQANVVYDNGTGATVSCSSTKVFYILITKIEVLGGGRGIFIPSGLDAHIHVGVRDIYLGSNNCTGIRNESSGEIHGAIDGISFHSDVPPTGTTAIISTDGQIGLTVNYIEANTAYNISGGSFSLVSDYITGAQTVTGGTVNVFKPSDITAINSAVAGKEDSLGNPSVSGYLLSSTTGGVRSWISTPGNMLKSTYDPTNKNADSFNMINFFGKNLDFDIDVAAPTYKEGRLTWNNENNTLDIHTGLGDTIIQVGQEDVVKIYNNTGAPLLNGYVVYKTGGVTGGFPEVAYSRADDHAKLNTRILVMTGTVNNGEYGFATSRGAVRGIDTSTLSIGKVYLSAADYGELTNTKPLYPNYSLLIGIVTIVDAINGELIVDTTGAAQELTIVNFWNGTMRESFDFIISSDGATITGSLERQGGGDLTMIFDEGFTTLDTTPAKTITLTPGTATVPVKNYVYIPKDTKLLTVSTVDWPPEPHIRIADCVLANAARTQLYGPLANRNWNDHIQEPSGQGDASHIGQWIRSRPAAWFSGVEGSVTITGPTSVYFSNTAGKVFQKHLQDFDAHNMQTGSIAFVPNHPTTPYTIITNIASVLVDATGASLSGRYFTYVLWGVNSKSVEPDQIMMNLPEGSYGNLTDAINDVSNFTIYNIPSAYNGTGFLIGAFVFQHSAGGGGVWTLQKSIDLRGVLAGATGGAGVGGGGVTTFLGLTDTPASYAGFAGDVLTVNDAQTGIEFINGVSGTFSSAGGKVITVTKGIITSIV